MVEQPKKKVLFTSHVASFAKFNYPLMQWFKERGYEVHYASAGGEEVLGRDKHFTIPFERNPFRVNNLKSIKQLKKIIDSEGYDIIHTHTPMGGVVTRLAAINARKKGTRVIYTAHGFHFYKGASLLNWAVYYPIEKMMARYTDTLITINEEDFKLAKNNFKTDVRYVPGVGIDLAKFKPVSDIYKNKKRSKYGYSHDEIIISCVAEFTKNKNQGFLIQSFKEIIKNHKNARLLLVGNVGNDETVKRWKNIIKDSGLFGRVELLGYRNDIKELVSLSDIIVLASAREGLPASLIEAIACGKPVVCSDIRGHRDIKLATPSSCKLYGYNDLSAYVKCIEFFIKNKNAGFGKGIDVFSINNVVSKMSEIYKDSIPTELHILSSNKLSGAENVVIGLIRENGGVYCSPDGEIRNTLSDNDIEYSSIRKLSVRQIMSVIKALRPKAIYAHDFRASLLVGCFFGKKYNVISYIHQNPDWLDGSNLKTFLYKKVINNFKNIIVVSPSIKDRKLFEGSVSKKVVIKYNKVDEVRIVKLASEKIDQNYDLCFVGRLQDVKQPEHFVDLISKIKESKPDVKAVIVGDGELMESVKTLIDNFNLGSNIDMVGFQKNPYKYINASKFLVITSKNEGLPMAVLEAVALGKCILSYDYPTLIDVFKDEAREMGFLCSDMYKISRTANSLLSDDSYFSKVIDYQKMRVYDLYDLNESALNL